MTVGSTVCGLFDKSTGVFVVYFVMYFDMVINMYTYNVIDLCNNGFVGYDVTTKLIVIV